MPDPTAPAEPAHLIFESTEFDPSTGRLTLAWTLRLGRSGSRDRRHSLVEQFEFGPVDAPLDSARAAALDSAVRLLHWIAGVSYWKVACRGTISFKGSTPDSGTAALLEAVYRDGLAELAYRNELEKPWWPDWHAQAGPAPPDAPALGLADRVLLPMGGGKDSLVALERARKSGLPIETVQVGQAPLIAQVAERTGLPHRRIPRRLDPTLSELNAEGAINGHVPITAINAAVLAVAAVLWDFRYVAFANERSADRPTLEVDGRAVNHQWAKSYSFEAAFGDRVQHSIAADLRVFSLLRRERELAVVREFVGLEQYHDVFSSCNRNFHLDGPRTTRWCGRCPKCLFVFLALAPFCGPATLHAMFGDDLLAREKLTADFAELLELDGHRPFECVGEAEEARAALRAAAEDPRWSGHAVVRALIGRLGEMAVPSLESLCEPGGDDRIPEVFRVAAG